MGVVGRLRTDPRVRSTGLRLLTKIRTATYGGRGHQLVSLLGRRRVERYRLLPPPEGQRRLDVGSGQHPRPDYVHLDSDPSSTHVEFLVSGHLLPLPDSWADEVNATHMLEHVPPPRIERVLGEWLRVLRPGGLLELHVPNGASLARALLDDDTAGAVWAAQNAIFGYWAHPADVRGPEALAVPPDHKILFTFGMLEQLLTKNGFADVRDVTGDDPCRHLLDWEPYIPRMCLELRATSAS
jgi:SAM-dependent methyltransferase